MLALALILAAAPDAGTPIEALASCMSKTVKADAACAVRSDAGLTWVESTATSRETLGDSVRAFLNAQAAAWNRGDLEGFVASYADDASFVTPAGITRGRDQVLARYKKRYPDKAAMGTLTFEFLDVRPTLGAVTVTAKWNLTFANKKPPAGGHTLVVVQPRGASWMVVQDASM